MINLYQNLNTANYATIAKRDVRYYALPTTMMKNT